MRRSLIMISIFLWTSFLSAEDYKAMRYVMGTLLEVEVSAETEGSAQKATEDVFEEIDMWDKLLSTYKTESDISRLNRDAGGWTVVDSKTLNAIQTAVSFAQLTRGTFDPTIGVIVNLWNFEGGEPHIPRDYDIRKAINLVNYKYIEWDERMNQVRLMMPGMALTLAAIGKGYAMDQALERIKKRESVKSTQMNFGGQFLFWDRDTIHQKHKVALRDLPESGFYLEGNGSVATSSQSEKYILSPRIRYVGPENRTVQKRYGHILNPKTGYSIEKIEAVVVIAPTATEADAISTALFVMGHDKAMKWVEWRQGVETLINTFDTDGKPLTLTSSGWPREPLEEEK